jgi:hypothetical protein
MKVARKTIVEAPVPNITDAQFAEYCYSLLDELQNIASLKRLDYLAQFLSVCLIEARRIQNQDKRKAN